MLQDFLVQVSPLPPALSPHFVISNTEKKVSWAEAEAPEYNFIIKIIALQQVLPVTYHLISRGHLRW